MNIFQAVGELSDPSRLAITVVNRSFQKELSYQDLFGKIDHLVKVLSNINLFAGDRVAIVAKNSANWVASFLAIAKLNLTSVPIDKELTHSEIKRQVEWAQVQCIICEPEFSTLFPDQTLVHPDTLDIMQFVERNMEYAACSSEIATIIFSSGTTSNASGIMHTHDALIKSTLMTVKEQKLNKKDKYLGLLPLSHIYGIVCTLLGPLLTGANVCYVQEMDGTLIQNTMQFYKPTVFPGVPRMFELFYQQIIKKANKKPITSKLFKILLQLSRKTHGGRIFMRTVHKAFGGKLRRVCCAGSAVSQEIASFYIDAGFTFLITYGATETGIPTLGHRNTLTSNTCGYPYPGIETKIEDDQLLIRSPYSMVGYWRNPTLTESIKQDGWIATGDLMKIDANGYYSFIGRCKDTIQLSSGKKIDPNSIEEELRSLISNSEFAVCGIPDHQGNDEIHVFIVADSIKPDIVEKIRQKPLKHGMYISDVHCVEEIPKTSLQKPKRFLLKEIKQKSPPISGEDKLKTLISHAGKIEINEISDDKRVFKDFHLDSLGTCSLWVEIEEEFGVTLPTDLDPEITVAELRDRLENNTLFDKEVEYPLSSKRWDRFLFGCLKRFLKRIYSARVVGQDNLPSEGGYIICSNHVSNLDYIWLTWNMKKERLHRLCCMAKAELLKLKIVGGVLFRSCNLIPVSRKGFVGNAIKSAKERLTAGWALIILPEGTRSLNGELNEFKPGSAMLALESGVPIVPAYIEGAYDIYPRNRKLPRFFDNKGKKFEVNVYYGKPIDPTGHTIESLTRQLEEAVRKLNPKYIK